jgi:DAACS family dicarboxylate/amino acid:cation (Na+ or H+) symporter
MLTMVLQSVGLPVEGVALVAGIDRVLDMARTTLNVMGDSTGALVVSKSEGELMDVKLAGESIS